MKSSQRNNSKLIPRKAANPQGGKDASAPSGLTHPCLRVWGRCKFGEGCAFVVVDRSLCLYCLRGDPHRHCSGRTPSNEELEAIAQRDIGVWQRLSDHVQHKQDTAKAMRELFNNPPPREDGSSIPPTWKRVSAPKPEPLPTPPAHPVALRFPPLPTAESEEEGEAEGEGETIQEQEEPQEWFSGQEYWPQQAPYGVIPNVDPYTQVPLAGLTDPSMLGLFAQHPQAPFQLPNPTDPSALAPLGPVGDGKPRPLETPSAQSVLGTPVQPLSPIDFNAAVAPGGQLSLQAQQAIMGMNTMPMVDFPTDPAQTPLVGALPVVPPATTATLPLPLTHPHPALPGSPTHPILTPESPLQLQDPLMQDYPKNVLRGSGALRFSNGEEDK